jgi:glutamate-ammonia-ligase adenylyltransferase
MNAVAETVYEGGFGAEDAQAMREMREKVAAAGGPGSVKRARAGGAVDIEWLAQAAALRHGRDDARLRLGNVALLLARLKDAGHVDPQTAADLHAAYAFLATLESKLRIVADAAEDRLPDDPVQLRALARRLGYADTASLRAEAGLVEEYEYHRDVAARAFTRAMEP